MKLVSSADILTEDEARSLAIDWSNWQSEEDLSYGELIEWHELFSDLAARFNLTDEFTENGII